MSSDHWRSKVLRSPLVIVFGYAPVEVADLIEGIRLVVGILCGLRDGELRLETDELLLYRGRQFVCGDGVEGVAGDCVCSGRTEADRKRLRNKSGAHRLRSGRTSPTHTEQSQRPWGWRELTC